MAHRRTGLAAGTAALSVAGLLAATVALPVTTAGAQSGPTVSVDKACYVDTASEVQKITISGTGWTPGDAIQLSDADSQIFTGVTANASGDFTAVIGAPIFDDLKHAYDTDTITASDDTAQRSGTASAPVTATSASFDYTELSVTAPKSTKALSKKLTFVFAGFNGGSRLYAHYIYKSKLRANVDFGRVDGPCGLLTTEERIYPPSAKPALGDYIVQFDNDPRYSSRTLPHYRTSFQIYRL